MGALIRNKIYASNCSLKRATPLAVWVSGIKFRDMALPIKADVDFTHPNQLVAQAIWQYDLAI